MAEKKTAAAPEAAKSPVNPMQEYVTVNIPRPSSKEENYIFVGLNGKAYKIKKGEPVKVPKPIYEILCESQRLKNKRDDFYDEIMSRK